MKSHGLLQIAPVQARCYVCGAQGVLTTLDTDTHGHLCEECTWHAGVAAIALTHPTTGMTYPDAALKEANP